MAEEVNPEKIREELKIIYNDFLNSPTKKSVIEAAIHYDRVYGGLTSDTYQKYLPQEIVEALGGLPMISQYGLHPDSHEVLSNSSILASAKTILSNLNKIH